MNDRTADLPLFQASASEKAATESSKPPGPKSPPSESETTEKPAQAAEAPPAPEKPSKPKPNSRSRKTSTPKNKEPEESGKQAAEKSGEDESRNAGNQEKKGNDGKQGEGKGNEGKGGGKKDKRRRKRKERKKDVPTGPPVEGEGLLEISNKGFGFLRLKESGFQQSRSDIFVTPETVRTYGLRDGMWIKCVSREGNRGPQLSELLEVSGREPDDCKELPYFEELTAINPHKRYTLETKPNLYTTRVIDLITPIGRGQRGLIVAPPRTGKTTLLQQIAEAVHENHDYVKVMMLLVDERPEEVTELQRALPFVEFMASSNDQDVKSHTRIAQLAIERAKRLVEAGEDVFLLLDSITRLARAFNNAMKGNKRGIQSGGLGVGALEIPRKLFAAARNTREAGSLTIVATCLIETNSKMDEAIFQEFKGTGNMELRLDRKIAEQYIWPAVNIHASGTRREELLLANHQLEKSYVIRRGLAGHKPIEAIERLLSLMERFPSNAQMLMELKAQAH